ncbi:DMT family transporter [Clostridium beijerinckii]|uniref:DMT family transporter n=1 Tax=Clostridium beijerinckii TaxID=1520 RepID=UPI00098C1B81|nr:EamA family transporter [Clostridium beijerinckii]MBA8934014.1 drug/metabolite transporter (DMT)-like permease [Clostridium beijerinckii]NOW05044.1 drug/metabolite transporter (DMT)-like permease [Clostridium beijerinckii]NRT36076.1 drug/metabolite transporter (DMT)-like permease [Clostridium beijerinckii]NRT44497.1 drug/metabolite transporter (DMT)-like permease [Clostridium beijerinckii]NRU38208.1 drug/metabolite transporter (DMT)-like permease [Clostridium beijerinckii]
MNFQPRIKGIILVIIGAMLWGISGTAAQYLFQKKGFSPEWLVVIRLLSSGIILLLYTFMKGEQNIWEVWKSKNDALSLIFFSVLGMLGVQYTYFAAIKYGNAATATILQYSSPVIITCYLAIRNKKIPKLKEIIAIGLAMLGTFFIITKGNIHSISISRLALFWGIASAFAAAFYTLQPCLLLRKWGSILVVGWGMLIGGIAFSFIEQPWNCTGIWSTNSILAIIFVVLFGTLIAFTCFLESLNYIKPTESSILSSAEPLSAAILSVLWLHEELGIAQWIGTACIITTIIILSRIKQ